MPSRLELSGHRGARGLWPENTLAGFAGALRAGVDALEFDVLLTRDGVAVVTHDLAINPDLARERDGQWLDPPGPAVCALTLAQVQGLDVGRVRPGSRLAALHPRQTAVDGQSVPTLDAVFRLAAPHAVRLDVELKTDPADPQRSPDAARLAGLVLEAAARAGVVSSMTLRSFDWRTLRHAAALAPQLRLCLLTDAADPATLCAVRAELAGRSGEWAPGYKTLTPDVILMAQSSGMSVKPWTVNQPQDIARLIAWGVDGICTDEPDVARAVMAQAGLSLPPCLAAA